MYVMPSLYKVALIYRYITFHIPNQLQVQCSWHMCGLWVFHILSLIRSGDNLGHPYYSILYQDYPHRVQLLFCVWYVSTIQLYTLLGDIHGEPGF